MGELIEDPQDTRLTRGSDTEPTPQAATYLVLSANERARSYVRPLRRGYRHNTCASVTTMAPEIAETYARDPTFYGSTYCVTCSMHRPVSEFTWEDGTVVGS